MASSAARAIVSWITGFVIEPRLERLGDLPQVLLRPRTCVSIFGGYRAVWRRIQSPITCRATGAIVSGILAYSSGAPVFAV